MATIFPKPVLLHCNRASENDNAKCVVFMSPSIDEELVTAFLNRAGFSCWRITHMNEQARRDCGAPDGAVLLEFPTRQKDLFYMAFDAFFAKPDDAPASTVTATIA